MVRQRRSRRLKLEAFWRAHLKAWRDSSLNQREYCELHGLPLKRFGNWRADLKSEETIVPEGLLYRRGGGDQPRLNPRRREIHTPQLQLFRRRHAAPLHPPLRHGQLLDTHPMYASVTQLFVSPRFLTDDPGVRDRSRPKAHWLLVRQSARRSALDIVDSTIRRLPNV